jgi:FHS family L-fucose permease-like MFS transporter
MKSAVEAPPISERPPERGGLFRGANGENHLFTFILVSSLFLMWGFCNGMIDVMDKHFQAELHLSLAQSAWVQFAHYLGYFVMSLPAGFLASRLGYKGGIIAGLLMVAVGGFWFIPATKIATFPAFLLGVFVIASGLTFLETVANPYSTVLGPKRYAATRINLSQSCNGVGWILGPIAGASFFYGQDASGNSTGSQTLWIPYAIVGAVVLVLAIIFSGSKLPDINSEDEFHLDDSNQAVAYAPIRNKGLAFSLLWLNLAVLSVAIGMIFSAIVAIPVVSQKLGMDENKALLYASGVLLAIGTAAFISNKEKVTNHSIWSHPHFSGATLTQFFYVAAQCGIFAYFINYMTTQIPPIPVSWKDGLESFAAVWNSIWEAPILNLCHRLFHGMFNDWFKAHSDGVLGLSDRGGSMLASFAFVCFLLGRVVGAALLKKFPAHRVLAMFSALAGACCLLIFCQLGWVSAIALFLSYFFMSIMFPTIFSLGIHGLGARAKKASSFIVMAIMGGAIMPKLMGHVGDTHGMSIAFIVPLVCFIFVGGYAFFWGKLSHSEGIRGLSASGGH